MDRIADSYRPSDFATLRLRFDRSWSVAELGYMFQLLTAVYRQSLVLDLDKYTGGTWISGTGRRQLSAAEAVAFKHYLVGLPIFSIENVHDSNHVFRLLGMSDLQVREIRIASPGFSDLTGVGRAIEAITKLIEMIIHIRLQSEKGRVEIDEKKENIRAMQVERAHKTVTLMKELGFEQSDIRDVILSNSTAGLLIDEMKDRKKLGDVSIR